MKITILNGGLAGDAFADSVVDELMTEYEMQGASVVAWRLRERKGAYCLGCFQCWTHSPGQCRIDDDMREVTASIIRCDVEVIVSPVTFGGYSSEIKKALDRSICLIMPFFRRVDGEVHHMPRYARFPRIRAVGLLREPDASQEAIFRRLVERNSINMHAPDHSVEFVYRNHARAAASANYLVAAT